MPAQVKGVLPAIKLLRPTKADGYRISARNHLAGAAALARLKNLHLATFGMVAGHALECILKTWLVRQAALAADPRLMKSHDLARLWREAAASGCPVKSAEPPQWCKTLNSGHNQPMHYRYLEGVHGLSAPPVAATIKEMRRLLNAIDPRPPASKVRKRAP